MQPSGGAAMSLATAAEYELLLAAGDPTTPQAPAELSQLCPREHELVALVTRGSTNAQIAIQLHISVRTVGSHLDRIRDKTGCRRGTDLTRMALQAGLAWSAGKPGPGSPPCPVPAVGRSIPPRPRRKGVIPPAERGESGPCHGGARSASLYLRPQTSCRHRQAGVRADVGRCSRRQARGLNERYQA